MNIIQFFSQWKCFLHKGTIICDYVKNILSYKYKRVCNLFCNSKKAVCYNWNNFPSNFLYWTSKCDLIICFLHIYKENIKQFRKFKNHIFSLLLCFVHCECECFSLISETLKHSNFYFSFSFSFICDNNLTLFLYSN